jgi:hypothetical protein
MRHDSVDEHERMVLNAGGVVVRYGRFYGPGTYHPDADDLPSRRGSTCGKRRVRRCRTSKTRAASSPSPNSGEHEYPVPSG